MVRHCNLCGKELTENIPFRCNFCNNYFCGDHRLPENHGCYSTAKRIKLFWPGDKTQNVPTDAPLNMGISRKAASYNSNSLGARYRRLKSWLSRIKGYVWYKILPRGIRTWIYRSPKHLSQNIAFLVIYGLVELILYDNIDQINEIKLFSIKLGSILLLCVLFLFVKKLYSTLRLIRFRVSTNQKVVALLLLTMLTTYVYMNQKTYVPQLLTYNPSIEYERFNPLPLNLSEIDIGPLVAEKPERINKNTYDIELLVYRETNKIRRNNGLRELVWDPLLADVARQHSLEMATTETFSHTNLEGEDPTDRAEKRGYSTVTRKGYIYQIGIGENIGMMPTGDVEGYGHISSNQDVADAMVDSWMNSKGHRENILMPNYEFIGVGVAYDLGGQYYLTQDFK